MSTVARWDSRIVDQGLADVDELIEHPDNWRLHPLYQQDALRDVLDKIGWVQGVIVNRKTKRIVDGHLRVGLAREKGEEQIPVAYVELDEEEERLVLATLDPLGAMAVRDSAALRGLISEVDNTELASLVAGLEETKGPPLTPTNEMVADADDRRRDVSGMDGPELVDMKCPECGYEFKLDDRDASEDVVKER